MKITYTTVAALGTVIVQRDNVGAIEVPRDIWRKYVKPTLEELGIDIHISERDDEDI